MIDLLLNELKEKGLEVEVRGKYNNYIDLLIPEPTQAIYDVIRTILHHEDGGVRDEGLCGGGFEFYPLKNGMKFAIAWGDGDGPTKIYLGKMGCAF